MSATTPLSVGDFLIPLTVELLREKYLDKKTGKFPRILCVAPQSDAKLLRVIDVEMIEGKATPILAEISGPHAEDIGAAEIEFFTPDGNLIEKENPWKDANTTIHYDWLAKSSEDAPGPYAPGETRPWYFLGGLVEAYGEKRKSGVQVAAGPLNTLSHDALDSITLYVLKEDSHFFDDLEAWDEGDQNPSRHLELIREHGLKGDDANSVFASYMERNQLTSETLEAFIKLGVDINARNNYYWTDQGDANAIAKATEYRRVNDMRILFAHGADPQTKICEGDTNMLENFVYGHSADYADVRKEQVAEYLEGIQILCDQGLKLSSEIYDYIEEEYVEGEGKKQIMTALVDLIE